MKDEVKVKMAVKRINERLQVTVSKEVVKDLNEVCEFLGMSKTDLLKPVLEKFVKQQIRRKRRLEQQA